jgi:CheY-like chemotaxis protein
MRGAVREFKVLVVDDESDTVAVVEKMLTGRGYSVSHAFDGAEALALAARYQPHVCCWTC